MRRVWLALAIAIASAAGAAGAAPAVPAAPTPWPIEVTPIVPSRVTQPSDTAGAAARHQAAATSRASDAGRSIAPTAGAGAHDGAEPANRTPAPPGFGAAFDSTRGSHPGTPGTAIVVARDSGAVVPPAAAGIGTPPRAVRPPASAPARPAGPTPPLNIAADNVTGSHGPEGDVILLNGNVRITRMRSVITSDHGRYLRSEGMLYLEQNVKLVDSTTTMTCNQASYSENDDMLRLQGNVVVTDHDATLRAPWATYDRRIGRAELFGGVDAHDKHETMRADSALYLRDSLLLKARGHVRGIDKDNKLELTARAVDWDRDARDAIAWGDPQLVSHEDQGHDTVIRARTLRVNTDTRVAEAVDSVTIVRDTLQARADYGQFDDLANYAILTGHPRAWDQETVVTGDTLEMWTDGHHLQRVVVERNAVMDYAGREPLTLGEKSRLSGDQVTVYFTDDDIDSLVSVGKAHNDYTAVPRPGKASETNLAQGDTITVFFLKRKIDRARVEGKASGEYQFAVAKGDTAAAADERVRYDARTIEYQVSRNRIVLDPGAHLTYRDLELTARRVEFDLNRQTLVAEGKPELVEHGDKVTGNLMTYDLESRVGNIYKAETEYEAGLYHGERIRKVSDKELDVMNGSYSTCNLPEPHYHFASRWMKIYLKDKLVAKPVVFYVKHVPLLALPFWVFPLKPGRHSGFMLPTFQLGFSNRAGQFFRNAGYYWAPNDYMDLTVDGDYYAAEPSWVVRTEGNYKLMYVLDGTFNGSFARDEGIKTENWDFDADHTQELTPRSRLVARASFVSSRDYNSSNLFGRSLSQRLNRFLTSSVAISHNADWASFNNFVERRQDLDADLELDDPDGAGPGRSKPVGTRASQFNLTESLPSLDMSFPTRTAGSLGFLRGTPFEKALSTMYLSMSARFLSLHTQRAFVEARLPTAADTTQDSLLVLGQEQNTRRGFQTDASVSDARRAFGWLNLRPSLNTSVAVFDHDRLGNKLVPTGVWSAGMNASASFYGTFTPHLGALDAFRHVVFPSVTLQYSPDFKNLLIAGPNGTEQERFESFGGIGVSGAKQFQLALGLDQRLQVKLRHKDQITRIDNLLAWSMSSNYDFLWAEHGARHPLTPIGSAVTFQPPKYFNASMNFTTDPYNGRPLRSLTYYLGLNLSSSGARRDDAPGLAVERSSNEVEAFHDNWNVGLTYSYSGGYPGDLPGKASPLWTTTRNANAVTSYQFSPAWGVEYSASFDLTLRQIGTQRFSLTRDLHCWEATFSRTFTAGGEAEYYFRLGVKEQKEIYIERGTRSGSLGGIQ